MGVIKKIDTWVRQKKRNYICVTGVHGVAESLQNLRVRRAHQDASLVVPDGMPLVWIGKYLFGLRETSRIYGPDLMLSACELAQKRNYRIFLYGSYYNVLQLLKQNLKYMFPRLIVSGSYAPPFRELTKIEEEIVQIQIAKARPHIVLVGMSTPKQEMWMHANVGRGHPYVYIGIGAAFNFIAGTKRQAPKWIQHIGLEWLFRLIHEPQRLWGRYLRSNALFALYCIRFVLFDRGHTQKRISP